MQRDTGGEDCYAEEPDITGSSQKKLEYGTNRRKLQICIFLSSSMYGIHLHYEFDRGRKKGKVDKKSAKFLAGKEPKDRRLRKGTYPKNCKECVWNRK